MKEHFGFVLVLGFNGDKEIRGRKRRHRLGLFIKYVIFALFLVVLVIVIYHHCRQRHNYRLRRSINISTLIIDVIITTIIVFCVAVTFIIIIYIKFSQKLIEKRRRQRHRQRQKSMIWLAARGKIIVLHVQLALKYISWRWSAKWPRAIFKFDVLTKTRVHNINSSFITCLYMNTIRLNQLKGRLF